MWWNRGFTCYLTTDDVRHQTGKADFPKQKKITSALSDEDLDEQIPIVWQIKVVSMAYKHIELYRRKDLLNTLSIVVFHQPGGHAVHIYKVHDLQKRILFSFSARVRTAHARLTTKIVNLRSHGEMGVFKSCFL